MPSTLYVALAAGLPAASANIWPDRFSLTKQFEALKEAGCSGFCALNGFGDGYVIGTAPFCEATCSNSCPGRACIGPLPGGIMPDAGKMCVGTAAIDAGKLFAGQGSLADKFKEVLMDGGKACCCETLLPMETSETKHEPTPPGTTSCDDWCQDGDFGHGVTIGTAPFCGSSCASDCAGSICSASNSFFSDHGAGCATGDKVCCCAKSDKYPRSAANLWKKVTDKFKPPRNKLPTPFSCADLCQSGGWGGGEVIGTAPSCGASCADCKGNKCFGVSVDDVTDYGHGCWSGDKVCCCEKGQEDMEQEAKVKTEVAV
eukprot:TRINITY_DN8695_c0_g1_i1.p1 TRINITY_DN8695_c0_g1~~TRINITY_DN8695_c0_g1_i1.p1  ORF type:complete len:315 (-),score=67.85 TRINITY_DN8695_c0_g1_i1:198-1142(-)